MEEELFNFTTDSSETNSDIVESLSSTFSPEEESGGTKEQKTDLDGSEIDTDNVIDSESVIGSDIVMYSDSVIGSFMSELDFENKESQQADSLSDSQTVLLENELFSSMCDLENEIASLSGDSEIENNDTMIDEIDELTGNEQLKEEDTGKKVKTITKERSPPDTDTFKLEISMFTTGNNKKIMTAGTKQPKFTRSGVGRPAHSYLRPEKGHKSTSQDEKGQYVELFHKVRLLFPNDPVKWLKIQFRWVWIHLKLNDLPLTEVEMEKHLKIRKSTEYSVLRRIVEGDDVSYRYMILLVIDTGKDYVEGYDGFYSVRIQLDELLQKEIKNKRLLVGTKIKLFGCKFLLDGNLSILELKNDQPVMLAYYNGLAYASRTRVLGYKKKISFLKPISSILREGGVISCIKGNVKRVIETKYVVQVKDYRNTVDDLEKEYEVILNLMDKNKERINQEDVKVRMFINFILEDASCECLITSWMYIDKIKKGEKIMMCGLVPVLRSTVIHLTTTRRTYVKFLT